MALAGYGEYTGSPEDLERLQTEIGAIPGAVKKVSDDFHNTEAAVVGWAGYDDQFFDKADPVYQEQNKTIGNILASLDGLGEGLRSALAQSSRDMRRTQQQTGDEINDAMSQRPDIAGDDGKR
ncbi:hypothetical protein ABZ370_36250 [Streptomyces sp. NPDC005962]|uniref:hypothetical protein n=1 Tax=Streptomyces sp. NPDC005962 TaxID=3154466 RepID=UPI0033E72E5B